MTNSTDHTCYCGQPISATAKSRRFVTLWGDLNITRCPRCGQEQCREFPTAQELDDLYRSDRIYSPPSAQAFEQAERGFHHVVAELKQAGVASGRLLEVGCNAGYALQLFDSVGFDVTGVEQNQGCLEFVQTQLNLPAFGSFAELKPDQQFDVIFLSHVLEHVANLNVFLEEVMSLAKDDMHIYIKVPNYDSLYARTIAKGRWSGFIPKQHLWYFNKRSLILLMSRYGFSPLHLETRGFQQSQHPSRTRRFVTRAFGQVERLLDRGEEVCGLFKRQ